MPQIIVYGEKYSALLVQYLLEYKNICDGSCSPQITEKLSRETKLHLKTKYYSADCHALVLHDKSSLSQINEILKSVECCIFLPSNKVTTDEFIQTCVESFGDNSPELRFLVIIKDNSDDGLTSRSSSSSQVEETMAWCIDNAFEYIEIDLSDPIAGWEERDKEGLPRLMEALESHMWSTMRRLGQQVSEAGAGSRARPDDHHTAVSSRRAPEQLLSESPCEVDNDGVWVGVENGFESLNEYSRHLAPNAGYTTEQFDSVTNSSSVFKFVDTSLSASETVNPSVAEAHSLHRADANVDAEAQHLREQSQSELVTNKSTDDATEDTPVMEAATRGSGDTGGCLEEGLLKDFMDRDSDEEDEDVWGGLSSVLSQAKGLRNEVTSGVVSDDVRRGRAAMIATRLASMLNIDESDDSGSDS